MVASGGSELDREAEYLAEIGTEFASQPSTLTMRLPKALAVAAVAAWRREETTATFGESLHQRARRHRAGVLALIGLCVEETGRADGGQVVCELDASCVGMAISAADERGLLG